MDSAERHQHGPASDRRGRRGLSPSRDVLLDVAGVAQDALALKQQQQVDKLQGGTLYAHVLPVMKMRPEVDVLAAAPGMVRGMTGDAAPADNPLSKIMPQVVAVPRQVLNGVIGLTGESDN
eukprot:359159-Chlamydomonas_euryale.AAC.29